MSTGRKVEQNLRVLYVGEVTPHQKDIINDLTSPNSLALIDKRVQVQLGREVAKAELEGLKEAIVELGLGAYAQSDRLLNPKCVSLARRLTEAIKSAVCSRHLKLSGHLEGSTLVFDHEVLSGIDKKKKTTGAQVDHESKILIMPQGQRHAVPSAFVMDVRRNYAALTGFFEFKGSKFQPKGSGVTRLFSDNQAREILETSLEECVGVKVKPLPHDADLQRGIVFRGKLIEGRDKAELLYGPAQIVGFAEVRRLEFLVLEALIASRQAPTRFFPSSRFRVPGAFHLNGQVTSLGLFFQIT